MCEEEYKILTKFKSPAMTVSQYLQFSREVLTELAAFDDCFKNLHGWGTTAKAWSGFKPDWSDFEEIVFKQIADDKIRYENSDPENVNFTFDSMSFIGYNNSYSNTKKAKEGQVTVDISAGSTGKDKMGYVNIQFPEVNHPQFQDPDFVNRLFKKCIEIVDPEYAVVISNPFRQKVKKEEIDFWIGWQTYLANKEIEKYLPTSVNKEFFNRGVIFIMDGSIVYSNNEIAISKAIETRDKLSSKGFLNFH